MASVRFVLQGSVYKGTTFNYPSCIRHITSTDNVVVGFLNSKHVVVFSNTGATVLSFSTTGYVMTVCFDGTYYYTVEVSALSQAVPTSYYIRKYNNSGVVQASRLWATVTTPSGRYWSRPSLVYWPTKELVFFKMYHISWFSPFIFRSVLLGLNPTTLATSVTLFDETVSIEYDFTIPGSTIGGSSDLFITPSDDLLCCHGALDGNEAFFVHWNTDYTLTVPGIFNDSWKPFASSYQVGSLNTHTDFGFSAVGGSQNALAFTSLNPQYTEGGYGGRGVTPPVGDSSFSSVAALINNDVVVAIKSGHNSSLSAYETKIFFYTIEFINASIIQSAQHSGLRGIFSPYTLGSVIGKTNV